MAVLLETSRGDLVIDLYTEQCPKTCLNFLKLCKLKYYNNCKFHSIQEAFLAQTGDPTGTGRGGESVYQTLYGHQARFFEDELHPALTHAKLGTVGMAGAGKDMNASQFYITLATQLGSLDGKHTIFGEVSEGLETLTAIGGAFTDARHRPLQNIRIWHTIPLEDPFQDPPGLESHIPEDSPERAMSQGDEVEAQAVEPRDVENARMTEAHSRAVVLEMIGDLPEAEAKPPSDMLFVCKLNPVTGEEDLEIIFSRFGKITSCDIIRDWKTGDSLCYAFIGFDSDKAAEEAFFKMNNVLIDDRRIKVDFSQSVYHLWKQFREHKSQPPPAPGPASRGTDGAMPRAPQHPELGSVRAPSRELPSGNLPGQSSPHASRPVSKDHDRHPRGHRSRKDPDGRGSGSHGSRHEDLERHVSRRAEHGESHRHHRSQSDAGFSVGHDLPDRPRQRKVSPDGHRGKRGRQ